MGFLISLFIIGYPLSLIMSFVNSSYRSVFRKLLLFYAIALTAGTAGLLWAAFFLPNTGIGTGIFFIIAIIPAVFVWITWLAWGMSHPDKTAKTLAKSSPPPDWG